MNTTRATASAALPTTVPSATPADLLNVMMLLSNLIRAENDHLRAGLPATLFTLRHRKQELADDYAEIGEQVMTAHRELIAADAIMHKKLVDATFELRALTEENRHLLEGALIATRRRIEAIVSSIRKVRTGSSPYAKDGASLAAHFVEHPSRLKA